MDIPPAVSQLTEYCKNVYTQAESVIHQWGHIWRTTRGAVWFVRTTGGSQREQLLAYVAGILHDIVRPITEETCHAQASADKALLVLNGYLEFTISEREEIYNAIRDHRRPVSWKTRVHQSVYLSDKVLEHMGAYLDFRGAVWAGELSRTDLRGLEPVDAVITYYRKASPKFLTGLFPDHVKNLVEYQVEWNRKFLSALERGEVWACQMAETFFNKGRQKHEFEHALQSFNPHDRKQQKWTHEMRTYVTGQKFSLFKTLIDHKKN
ncbi:MAG: HD domain-containing protein [Theionarchaea archaeon]|nr:HD domain-containing protein [Theionarchaea archaeon]MBU7036651.1 HD domain-containing protein [Theionarchaea archaeon]